MVTRIYLHTNLSNNFPLYLNSIVTLRKKTIYRYNTTIECGPTANVMAALSNIGGVLCSTPQSLADAHY